MGRLESDVNGYRDLKVWQLGMDLTVAVYGLTKGFPSEERFGLVSQMRRSASSVPANIAEGQGRTSTKEFLRHLSIALGSLKELETFLLLARRLELATSEETDRLLELTDEESRMLRGLQKSLRKKLPA